MSALSQQMKTIIEENTLGFVATVDDDGTPNLSPKGTCLILDDDHVMFGEIRSPRTLANLRQRPSMEINFIDFFSRKGVRLKGVATHIARGEAGFEALIGRFERWGELCERINGIVQLDIERAKLVVSPIYDLGADENELRAHWRDVYLQRRV